MADDIRGVWTWTTAMWVDVFSKGLVDAELAVLVGVGDAALVVDDAYMDVGAMGLDDVWI